VHLLQWFLDSHTLLQLVQEVLQEQTLAMVKKPLEVAQQGVVALLMVILLLHLAVMVAVVVVNMLGVNQMQVLLETLEGLALNQHYWQLHQQVLV
jgi:hypothetical protein